MQEEHTRALTELRLKEEELRNELRSLRESESLNSGVHQAEVDALTRRFEQESAGLKDTH
jgi:hypothetical protein